MNMDCEDEFYEDEYVHFPIPPSVSLVWGLHVGRPTMAYRVTSYQERACRLLPILKLAFVVLVYRCCGVLISLVICHCSLWQHSWVFSSHLIVLSTLRQTPIFDKPLNNIFDMESIVGVMIVTILETIIFGSISLGELSDRIRVSYPDILEFWVITLRQNILSRGVKRSVSIKLQKRPLLVFLSRLSGIFLQHSTRSKIP